MAKIILTEEQLKKVSDAVTQAERMTTGEIVPVIVRHSDPYPGARWRIAVTFSLLCAFAMYWLLPLHDPIWYLAVQLPTLGLGYALGGWGAFLRLVASPASIQTEVHQRAVQAFHASQLSATREHTGILIFVSCMERRVVILADTGIHEKVTQATWDRVVDRMILRIQAQTLTEALIGAVEECGQILGEKFPAREGDNPNELPDFVRVEND